MTDDRRKTMQEWYGEALELPSFMGTARVTVDDEGTPTVTVEVAAHDAATAELPEWPEGGVPGVFVLMPPELVEFLDSGEAQGWDGTDPGMFMQFWLDEMHQKSAAQEELRDLRRMLGRIANMDRETERAILGDADAQRSREWQTHTLEMLLDRGCTIAPDVSVPDSEEAVVTTATGTEIGSGYIADALEQAMWYYYDGHDQNDTTDAKEE